MAVKGKQGPIQRPGLRGKLSVSPKSLGVLARRLGEWALDTVLPPQCLISGQPVDAQGQILPKYWQRIQFIGDPKCDVCGVPFPFDPGRDVLCTKCLSDRPVYDRARAAFVYDDASRSLVLGLKYGDRSDGVRSYGRWMARAGADFGQGNDWIVPVPLHAARLHARRFNQSGLLGGALAKEMGLPFIPDGLKRRRRTPSQKGRDLKARQRNVRGAFEVSDRWASAVQGTSVLLVDDVLTTGATVDACATALKQAGAAHVNVLTLARVVALWRMPI